MFQWVTIIATVIGSNIFAQIYRGRQREVVMPLSFLFTLLALAVLPTIGGPFHTVYIFMKFVVWMLALNGFPRSDMQNNPSLKAFLFFYLYMFGIGFTGLYVLDMSTSYIHTLIIGFGVGYFLVSWAIRTEGGMSKLVTVAVIAGIITVLERFFSGGMSVAMLDEGGRAMEFDATTGEYVSTTGVNGYALNLMTQIPFVFLGLLQPMGIKCNKWVKWCALFSAAGLLLLLIRTGSRNGFLGLVPCVWYVLKSTPDLQNRMKRIMTIMFLGLIVAVLIGISMKGVKRIRVFDYSASDTTYSTIEDAITSGRFSMYENIVKGMSFGQRIYGAGLAHEGARYFISRNTKAEDLNYIMTHQQDARVTAPNMHSMYVSIFFRTGVIGSVLFLVFLIISLKTANRLGGRGKMALMFLGVWMFNGIGESEGIIGGSILAGFGMGLLNMNRAANSEFLECVSHRWV